MSSSETYTEAAEGRDQHDNFHPTLQNQAHEFLYSDEGYELTQENADQGHNTLLKENEQIVQNENTTVIHLEDIQSKDIQLYKEK